MIHLHHLPEMLRLAETIPRATACGSLPITNAGTEQKPGPYSLGPDAGGESLMPEHEDRPRGLVEEATDVLEETRFSPDGRFLRPDERPVRAAFIDKVAAAGFCHRCVLATAARHAWSEEPDRLDQEELKAFAIGLAEGRVFTSSHLKDPNDIMSVFSVLALMRRLPPPDFLEKVGVVWEWLDKAGPRAINGMPMFFSCRFMHVADWARAVDAAKRIAGMRDDLVV